jgi:hypothetical protein
MGWITLPRARQVGREADRLRSLESNLKKGLSHTYTSPQVCLTWCLATQRENQGFAVQMYGVMYRFRVRLFPTLLKFSEIKPLFQKVDRAIASNSRPSYFLTSFSKVFEKVTRFRLH